MAKRKYNSVIIRTVNNGWEVDASAQHFIRNDDGIRAQSTFVFQTFDKLSKWLEENIKPTGDE